MSDFSIAAVVHHDDGDEAAAALWAAARDLQAQGCRVAGLLNPLDENGRHIRSQLVSVADGSRYPIFQNLGSGSSGCKLDSRLLAAAATVLQRAVDDEADVLFINKFGHVEIENHGLNDEYLAAAAAGIPVLTAVHRKYLADWQRFCGGEGVELPADAQAVSAWAQTLIGVQP